MQYQQLIPPEIGQQPADSWEQHDKHVSLNVFVLMDTSFLKSLAPD